MTRNDIIKKINNATPLEKRLIIELMWEIRFTTLAGKTFNDTLQGIGIKYDEIDKNILKNLEN